MLRNLATPAVLLSAALTGSASAAITDNLVAYYDFEDLNNAPGLSGPNATEAGTGSYTGAAGGIAGNAAEFTGTTNDKINTALGFGGGGSNQFGNSFTVSAWYNLDTDATSDASRFFVFEGDTDYDISYGLRGTLGGAPGNNDSQTFTNGAGSQNFVDAHVPGQWQHVLLTYQSDGVVSTITTYIDGIDATGGSPIISLTSGLTSGGINIGNARDTALNRAFDGKIDEFAAWNRVLTAQEIADVRAAGLAGESLVVPEPGSLALLGLGGLLIARRRRGA